MAGIREAPIFGLLERYVLGCIGFLPPDQEAHLSRRIQQTYRQQGDWKGILSQVLRLDSGVDELMRQKWVAYQKAAVARGETADPSQFARLAVDDACFAELTKHTRPPQNVPPPPWGPEITVKAVGFWRWEDGRYAQYPQPQSLVRPGWHADELKNILAYLHSGHDAHPNIRFCGWSTCRFEGCREGEFNGSGEKTDGEWGWPDGLAHYIERHAVILPEGFIETMRANKWRPPPSPSPPPLTCFDYDFWIKWSANQ